MNEKRVRVLHYARQKGRDGVVQAIDRKIGTDLLGELEQLGIEVTKMKCRSFMNGHVIMYYNDVENRNTISINGRDYGGNVVFVSMDNNTLKDLTVSQIRAIKAVIKRK